jgi:uncharacterized protein (TIGR02147 family)
MNNITVKEAASKVSIMQYTNYSEYLRSIHTYIKKERTKYSYYQFAEELGFSSSNVIWLVVDGRRKLTKMTTSRVISGLGLSGPARKYFTILVKHNNTRSIDKRKTYLDQLIALKKKDLPSPEDKDKIKYFSEWFYPVLREMIGLKDFSQDESWIAANLYAQILPKEIKEGMELLESLGLIRFDEKTNRFEQTGDQIELHNLVANMAGVYYHETMLDIAKKSITMVPQSRRDYNAVTLCVSDKTANSIKHLVQELCEKTMKLEQEDNIEGKKVIQMNIQLFPLTKTSNS